MESEIITADMLLNAYAQGYFPMGESRYNKELHWFYPKKRGIIPLDTFHISASLKKLLKKNPFELRVDTAFEDVMRNCADIRTEDRKDSWINEPIIALYTELFKRGFAHSVEVYKNDVLVGGLYGVSIGGAFFGESMFSKVSGASKVALVHLVECLREHGYTLLDTQYVNEHLKQFGVLEISRADYLARLSNALSVSPSPSTRFLIASDIKSSTFVAK